MPPVGRAQGGGMTRLSGFQVEDLAAAVLEDRGWRVHVAKPERRRIQDGHTVEYDQQYDLLGDWDLLAVHPREGIMMVQVTRDAENVSQKMAEICQREPRYPVEAHNSSFWFWVWTGETFHCYVLNDYDGYGWELLNERQVRDPKGLLARADTSIDDEVEG